MIRRARPDELELLLEIEREAGRAFAEIGMPEIAEDEPSVVAAAWVAVDEHDRPVAYLTSSPVRELAALMRHEAATIPGDAPQVAMRRP